MFGNALLLVGAILGLIENFVAASCTAKSIKRPELFGVEILDITANEKRGYEDYGFFGTNPPLPVEKKPIDFCNVTVTYTHPGLNDTIHVYVWLPLETWNGNFIGQGGGGYMAGDLDGLTSPTAMNYASASTDAGHSIFGDPMETGLTSWRWSLTSPGNVNLILLQNFAYRALDEMPPIAKSVIKSFYGKEAKYSYWNGCSTGGRQGLVMAQRSPAHFDGILSVAPAINWVTFLVTEMWGHIIMNKLNYYPPACELNAITQAAIKACDELDGVKDGLITAPGLCKFEAQTVVDQKFDCEGDQRKITKEAAQIAQAMWDGLIKDGKPIWYGLTHETSLPGLDPIFGGLASTACDEQNKKCSSKPFPISADWIKQFLVKEPSFEPTKMTEDEFFQMLRTSYLQYFSIIDSAEPDLRAFKDAGGKMIVWHGLADQLIYPNGSLNYYQRVQEIIPDIHSFYRYFEPPGVAHCSGGDGPFPLTAFNSLVDWVERGVAPEKLDTESFMLPEGATSRSRPVCPYPLVPAYKGGDSNLASSFECAESFNKFGKAKHDEL